MLSSNEVILNCRSRILRISGEDRVRGSNTRFTVDLSASSGGNMDNIVGFLLNNFQCPNVFDNVATYNNVIQLIKTIGGTVYNVVVPNNYYYIDDFITALIASINTAIPDTVAIIKSGNAPVQKLEFTFTGDEYTINYENSTIKNIIGLSANLVCPDGVATTAQLIYNLIGETEVYLHCKQLNKNGLIEYDGTFSVVVKLDLDKPYGSMCYKTYNNRTTDFKRFYPYISAITIRQMEIRLRNRQGDILNMPDNFNFSMMMNIFYK